MRQKLHTKDNPYFTGELFLRNKWLMIAALHDGNPFGLPVTHTWLVKVPPLKLEIRLQNTSKNLYFTVRFLGLGLTVGLVDMH